jgi:hypothetical protein
MSHSREFEQEGIAIYYSGDLSGDIVITNTDGNHSVTLPWRVLVQFVAERVADRRIAALENASAEEILGFPSEPA